MRDESATIGAADAALIPLTSFQRTLLKHLLEEHDTLAGELHKLLSEAEDGPIEVTVVDIRGDKVRLGITAPKSVEVHRREVFDARKREAAAAAAAGQSQTTL
jgi:carbon storage regulator CsrA